MAGAELATTIEEYGQRVENYTDASVVSSTAIHMIPRLLDTETRSIANTYAGIRP